MIKDIIKPHLDECRYYTEVRAQVINNRGVGILSGNIISNAHTTVEGVSARVYKNGVWGLASSSDYNDNAVRAVIESAGSNAEFLDRRAKKSKGALPDSAPVKFDFDRDYPDVPQKLLIDYASAVDSAIAARYPSLASRSVMISSDTTEKLIYTSIGTVARVIYPRTYMYVSMSAEAPDGAVVELTEVMNCGKGSFVDLFGDPSEVDEKLDSLYQELMRKREGVFSQAGYCDCIIDGKIAGMIAHEAVGHTVEADLVLSGSVANGKIGQQVAADCITIVDYAHTAFGSEAPLPVYIDDEGVEAKDAVLIENGILKGYMHNKESAELFGAVPCGNARAYNYSDEPLIRMRNTAISPGDCSLEDMISAMDKGYYLTSTMNGQADTTGEFMFGITMGYEIVNGKLGRAIRDTTISGVAFDMLKTVDMLGNKVEWSASGYCGKKQPMAVSDGGPAVKCKVSIGGR